MATPIYIGIDLGGTRVRAGRFSADLEMHQRAERLTEDKLGPDAVIDRMVELVKSVWPSEGEVAAVGVSAPGPIDPYQGVITSPPNLYGWHNVPLQQILQDRLGAPVRLGNDANLAALAENRMGAGRGYHNVIYLTLSTGIGSGVIIDDRLLIGSRGLGAECGHIILHIEEREGGRVSTLEKEAAGPAIARQAVAALKAGEQSSILALAAGNYEDITARTVSDAAKQGDELGLRLIARAGRMVGLGIVSLLHAFNPEIVIIGGGVAKGTGELLFKPMREAIQTYALDSAYWKDLVIAHAQLGEDVCLIGAAALATGVVSNFGG